jgi:hypothetical protein
MLVADMAHRPEADGLLPRWASVATAATSLDIGNYVALNQSIGNSDGDTLGCAT